MYGASRPSTAPVNLDNTYSWLSPVRSKPLPLISRAASGNFSSPLGWKKVNFIDQSDDLSIATSDSASLKRANSLKRAESFRRSPSLNRSCSLPSQLESPETIAGPSASALQRMEYSSEIKGLTQACADNYKKYRSQRKVDDFTSRYEHWQTYFSKHKSNVNIRITKSEFEKFWLWFESRVEAHVQDEGGIKLERVVTDFVDYGVVSSAQEAKYLLTQIDADGSGTISFEEFMEGMNSGKAHQIGRLKYFMSTIGKMSQAEREARDRENLTKRTRRQGAMSKLRTIRAITKKKLVIPKRVSPAPETAPLSPCPESKNTGQMTVDDGAATGASESPPPPIPEGLVSPISFSPDSS